MQRFDFKLLKSMNMINVQLQIFYCIWKSIAQKGSPRIKLGSFVQIINYLFLNYCSHFQINCDRIGLVQGEQVHVVKMHDIIFFHDSYWKDCPFQVSTVKRWRACEQGDVLKKNGLKKTESPIWRLYPHQAYWVNCWASIEN